MPITKSAKKALRSSSRKKVFNDRKKRVMKEEMKNIVNLLKEKNVAEAKKSLSRVYQAIDKAAKKGVIKKNNAARKKSRISKLIKKSA